MTYETSPFLRYLFVATAIALGVLGCGSPPIIPVDAGHDTGPFIPDGAVHCTTVADCDDHIPCTNDICVPGTLICSHSPDHARCDDGVFCNGTELCDLAMGCQMVQMHQTCNDENVCTIDRCIEATTTCEHLPRDLDQDGDPDQFCMGGTDCDDRDPTRSGRAPELCSDGIDNDCDAMIDEADCGRPPHDTCADALALTSSGTTMLAVAAATADYMVSCTTARQPDVAVSFTLTEPHDVSITGEADGYTVALGLRTTCDAVTSELDCNDGYPGLVRRRALPAGTYYVIVQSGGDVSLNLQLSDPTTAPTNETCTTATVVPATGGHFTGSFVDVHDDLQLSCNPGMASDLVYEIDLTASSDVSITLGTPASQYVYWSLRSTCGTTADLRCEGGTPADGTVHRLDPGTYYLVIEGSAFEELDYDLTIGIAAGTPPVHGDTCSDPIALTLGTAYSGTLTGAQDDYSTTCGYFYRDIVHSFHVDAASDIDIEINGGATAYLNASLRTTCTDGSSQQRCVTGAPISSHLHNVSPGDYFLVVEGSRAGAYTITVTATTPPLVPTPATGNENCGSAINIPPTGGFWSGTTVGTVSDYDPHLCGISATPAGDVAFRLDLAGPARVFATTEGSSFDTVLYRMVNSCHTGGDVACDDFSGAGDTGQLAEQLPAGTYFYVIDGFGAAAGNYEFQVFITPGM